MSTITASATSPLPAAATQQFAADFAPINPVETRLNARLGKSPAAMLSPGARLQAPPVPLDISLYPAYLQAYNQYVMACRAIQDLERRLAVRDPKYKVGVGIDRLTGQYVVAPSPDGHFSAIAFPPPRPRKAKGVAVAPGVSVSSAAAQFVKKLDGINISPATLLSFVDTLDMADELPEHVFIPLDEVVPAEKHVDPISHVISTSALEVPDLEPTPSATPAVPSKVRRKRAKVQKAVTPLVTETSVKERELALRQARAEVKLQKLGFLEMASTMQGVSRTQRRAQKVPKKVKRSPSYFRRQAARLEKKTKS